MEGIRDGFLKTYEIRRPGRAGLWHAPTPLVPEVGDMGQENGFFDNPVSVIFHWSADPNAVGDCRRRALPGLRVLWSKADAGASAILTG